MHDIQLHNGLPAVSPVACSLPKIEITTVGRSVLQDKKYGRYRRLGYPTPVHLPVQDANWPDHIFILILPDVSVAHPEAIIYPCLKNLP